jgi:hypothetical protein
LRFTRLILVLACYSSGNDFVTFNSAFGFPGGTGHPIYLKETRLGFYQETPSSTGFAVDQQIRVEIYKTNTGTGVWGTDLVQAYKTSFWNKQNDIGSLMTPRLVPPGSLGPYYQGQRFNYRVQVLNTYGKPCANMSGFKVEIVSQAGSGFVGAANFLATGTPDNYYYNYQSNLFAGTYPVDSYVFRCSGYYVEAGKDPIFLGTESPFNIQTDMFVFDVAQLGVVTGKINDASPTASSFITTLPGTADNCYNGQILQFTNLLGRMGQGRIISAWDNATKRITLNKPLSAAPTNGFNVQVYPIGGELNVS